MTTTTILELRFTADPKSGVAYSTLYETYIDTTDHPGCLGATVLIDDDAPTHVLVTATWDVPADGEAYRGWIATFAATDGLGLFLAAPPKVTVLTVADDFGPERPDPEGG